MNQRDGLIEIAKRMRFGSFILSTLLSAGAFSPLVHAGPTGGNVVGGSGSINQSGLNTTINQTTQNMAINWQSYNVNVDERVQYIQPNSSSISLNRILSNNGSTIAGRIDANGQVILVNPNGVFFTPTSVINVGGIIASGLDIQPTDFMNGNYIFNEVLGTDGAVINSGIINASLGGNVALIGKQVKNEGVIVANLGTVTLAAGKQAVLTFDQGGLLGVRISEEILQEELGVDPAVINSGEIMAEGGRVLLTASTSQDVFSQAVNTNGLDQVTSVVVNEDGTFTLGGGADVVNSGIIDTSTSSSDQPVGRIILIGENVTSSGDLYADAASGNAGEIELHSSDTTLLTENSVTSARSESNGQGGTVKVLGDKVGLFDQSTVDVSGANGGGQALIGGDFQGRNVNIRNASATVVGRETNIYADSLQQGDGGKVILWSDQDTYFWSNISSRGGALLGDGGLVETSGLENLLFDGTVDLSAANGANGLLLLDPLDIDIVSGDNNVNTRDNDELTSSDLNVFFTESSGSTFDITANRIELILESGSVLLEARRDINIDANINTSGNSNNLTMLAGDDITVNADVIIGSGNLLMIAGSASCQTNCSVQGGGGGGVTGRNIYIDGELRTTGSIELYAADHVIIDERIGTTSVRPSSVAVRAGDSILVNAINNGNDIEPGGSSDNGQIIARGNVLFTAADGALQTDQITFDTGSGLVTTDITVAPDAGNSVTGTIEVEGDVTTNGGDFTATTTAGYFDNWWNTSPTIDAGTGTVSITANGNDGSGAGALLGDITAGSISVTTTAGQIGQSIDAARNLAITGTSSFNTDGYRINLQNPNNDLRDTITLSNTGTNNIDLFNNSLTTILGVVGVGGNLTVTVSQNLTVSNSNTGGDDIVGSTGSDIQLSFGQQDNAGYLFTADGTITTGVGGSITVTGGAGGDAFDINATDFTSSVITLTGSGGTDTLNAADRVNTWGLTSTDSILNANLTFSSIETLVGNAQNDTFTLPDSGNFAGTLYGRGGTNDQVQGGNRPNLWNVSGAGIGDVTGLAAGNTFNEIETLMGNQGTDDFTVGAAGAVNTINGGTGAGSNSLTGRNALNTWTVNTPNGGSLAVTSPASTYVNTFTNIQTLTGGNDVDTFNITANFAGSMNGATGNDLFNLNSTGLSGIQIDGGADNDTLTAPNEDNYWDIDAAGTSAIYASALDRTNTVIPSRASFNSIEAITGGNAIDDINLVNPDSLTGLLDGGAGGSNILRLGADGVTVQLGDRTLAAAIADANVLNVNRVETIEAMVGTPTDLVDTLRADAGANIWAIGGTTSVGSVTFSNFGVLTGGSVTDGTAVDTFNISADFGGTINGGLIGTANDDTSDDNFNFQIGLSDSTYTGTVNGGLGGDAFDIQGTNITFDNTLNGGGGMDTLAVASEDNYWSITNQNEGGIYSNQNRTAQQQRVAFTDIETLNGNAGVDEFLIVGAAGEVTQSLDGGTDTNNTLIGRNADNEWDISGTNSGVLYTDNASDTPVFGTAYVNNFTNIQNLTGGSALDIFVMGASGNIEGTINGAAGANTLGGRNAANEWDVSGANSGALYIDNLGAGFGTVYVNSFSNIQTLTGGIAADRFVMGATGVIANIDGGSVSGNTLVARQGVTNAWNFSSPTTGTLDQTNPIVVPVRYVNDFQDIQNFIGGGGSEWADFSNAIGTFNFDANSYIGFTGVIGNGSTSTITGQNGQTNNWEVSDLAAYGVTAPAGTLDGTDDGVINQGLPDQLYFVDISNLTGGNGDDNFSIEATGNLTRLLSGGGGVTNTLNILNPTIANVEIGTTGTVANLNVTGLSRIDGNGVTRLISDSTVPGDWTVTETNNGILNAMIFNNFSALQGGTNDDTFRLSATINFNGTMNGGAGTGTDEIIAGDRTVNNWVITNNNNTGTVTGLTGNFSDIETLTGNTQQDIFTLHTTVIFAGTINGAGGSTDELRAGNRATNNWGISDATTATVTGLTGNFSAIEILTGGGQQDIFTLHDTFVFSGSINGNGGLNDELRAGDRATNAWIVTAANNTGTVTGLTGTFSAVEILTGNTGRDAFTLHDSIIFDGSINGAGGNNDEVIGGDRPTNSWNITAANNTGTVTGITGTFSFIETLTGNTGQDNFALHASIDFDGDIDGAGGTTNTLTGGARTNNWTIDGANGNTVTGLGTNNTFTGIQNLNGSTGNFNDTFTFTNGGSIAGLINGGSQQGSTNGDVVDMSQLNENITIRIGVGQDIVGIERVIGNNDGVGNTTFNSELVGENNTNNWSISGTNSGSVDGVITFIDFNNLTGNSGDDIFTFAASGVLSGIIDGDQPNNTPWIPGNVWTPWSIGQPADRIYMNNVANVDVQIGVDFVNIELIEGSNANDGTLRAAPGTNNWNITGTNTGIVNGTEFRQFNDLSGGTGADRFEVTSLGNVSDIRGGAGDDIFIVQTGGVVGNIYGDAGDDNFDILGAVAFIDGGADTDSIILREVDVTFTVGDDLSGFEGVVAANGGTIVARNNTTTTWLIDELGGGDVSDTGISGPPSAAPESLGFSGFTNITGGDGTDSFIISSNGSASGLISGQGGADTLTIDLLNRNLPLSQINYDGGGDVGDTITVNGPANVYTETYIPDQNIQSLGAFDQLGYDTASVDFNLNYRAVDDVSDNIQVVNLSITNADASGIIQLGTNTFGATNSVSVDVGYAALSKDNISVDAQNGGDVEIIGNVNIGGVLTLTADQVREVGTPSITATGLTLDGVTLAGTNSNGLTIDVTELRINNHSGSAYLDELNGLTLAQMSNTTGLVDVTALGLIDSNVVLVSSGGLNLVSTAGSVDLSGQRHQLSGPLTLYAANDVDFMNGVMTNLVDVTAQNLMIDSTGDITDSGILSVTVNTVLASSGDIVLDEANNFNNVSITAANDATINDIDDINIDSTDVTGNLTVTAGINGGTVGNIAVGNINAGVMNLTSNNGGIFELAGASSLTANQINLRATNGIGSGAVVYDDASGFGAPDFSSAINTNTPILSAINTASGGVSAVVIDNSGDLTIRDLRNGGDILLSNTGTITFDIDSPDTGSANIIPVGAIDANFGGSVDDIIYAGSVVIQSDTGTDSIYTLGFDLSGVDIIAENLFVTSVIDFGSQTNPIRLRVNNQFTLFASTGYVTYPYGQPARPVTTTADLVTISGISALSGQQLIEIESLADVDPAIFTEVRNYNHDDIAIKLPADQRYTDEEEEEEKKKKNL